MKTRDELAEMFAVATAQEYASTDGQPDDLARWAFACADAFVAERERRGAATRYAECGVCGGGPVRHLDMLDTDHGGDGTPVACCGRDECCDVGQPGWSRAPLATPDVAAKPAIVPVKFDADGFAEGDGWDVTRYTGHVVVKIDFRPGEDAGDLTAKMLAAVGRGP